MRKDSLTYLPFAIAVLIPILAVAQTPDPNPAINEWKLTENEIRAVQTELTQRNYYKSKITGTLDKDTRAAVRAYQADNGLNASGSIDAETYHKLGLTYPAKANGALNSSGVRGDIGKTFNGAVSKSKDAARNAGSVTFKGVKGAGERIYKHKDSDIQAQIRNLLQENPDTRSWSFEVKKKSVIILNTPPNQKADIGTVVSNIRLIPGVETIFVRVL